LQSFDSRLQSLQKGESDQWPFRPNQPLNTKAVQRHCSKTEASAAFVPFEKDNMNSKLICVATLTLLTIVPAAFGSNWYVDGKHGNDNNNCKSRQHACKTISNAISLTLPGDSIFVAPRGISREYLRPLQLEDYRFRCEDNDY
jgi:hypothetical protein